MEYNLKIVDITPNSNLKLSKKEFDVDVNRLSFTNIRLLDKQKFKLITYNKNRHDNCFHVKLTEKEHKFISKELEGFIKIRFKFKFNKLVYLGIGSLNKYEIESGNILLTMTNSKYYRNCYHI